MLIRYGVDRSPQNPYDGEIRNTTAPGQQAYAFDLSGANLFGSSLTATTPVGAPPSPVTLMNWNLSRADLSEVNGLAEADLRGANLSGANLIDTSLEGANLSGANLSRAALSGANLSGANLTGANLTSVDLQKSWTSTRPP
jgi:uncharacterized protein YjbI with pentapeptide repeats